MCDSSAAMHALSGSTCTSAFDFCDWLLARLFNRVLIYDAMTTPAPQHPFAPLRPAETWRMEQFCRAYVQAIAASAGCQILTWSADNERIDATLARHTELATVRGARLDIQLKATATRCRRATYVGFPIDLATYDALRPTNVMVPRILVVLLMNQTVSEWTHHTETRLALRRCAYWASVRGAAPIANRASKTIRLPRTQVFDAQALDAIFTTIENGGFP